MDLFIDEKASTLKVIKLLLKHWLLIVVFAIIGLSVGIGITFFIPKKYYAFAIIFPPNSNLGLNMLEDPRFGNSLDADQLMQLLESKDLKDSIISKFKLDEYYEIDKSDKSWNQKLDKKYFQDISFTKTRYYSVVIKAEMKDPDLCANVVNSIVEIVDELRMKIIRKNQLAAFNYSKELYENQILLVDSLKEKIYSQKEMSDPDNILYNHILENTKTNYYNPKPFVTSPEMERLVEAYTFEQSKLFNLKGDYSKARFLIKKPLGKVFVVNKAIPNYKKISPSFLLNASIGFFSSLLFIVLFVIVRERFSEISKLLQS